MWVWVWRVSSLLTPPPPPHRALREGGVAGVEEGLAPDGAAPSPSGVPDGWGDGDREMEMEMGMQMERGMEMGLGMEMETEMEIEMVMEIEMEKEMGMEMALEMEMEIMDAPPLPPSPHVVVDVPHPNPTSPIAPSSTTHQAGYPGGVWVALTHGAAWRRGAHPQTPPLPKQRREPTHQPSVHYRQTPMGVACGLRQHRA